METLTIREYAQDSDSSSSSRD